MTHFPGSRLRKLKRFVLFILMGAFSFSAHASDLVASEKREARAWFLASAENQCRRLDEIDALFASEGIQYPIRHAIVATDRAGNAKTEKAKNIIFEFFCDAGAYNARHIFVSFQDGFFQQLAFSQPTISVDYQSDSPESAVKSVSVVGFEARLTITNPEFDIEAGRLKETTFWRGLGDAASEVWWHFRENRFVLTQFRIDASYDGEINPSHDFSWPAKQK